jgi:hypothetical protein
MKNARIVSVVFLSVFVICLSAEAAAVPKAAKLVPPETILLVEAENFSQLQSQFEKTNLYKFYKDAAMAGFVENVKQNIRKEVLKLDENNLARVFYNAGLYPAGRVALALVLDERTKDANEPPMLIVTQWGDKADKIKDAVKQLVQKNIDKGGRQKPVEDYKGVNIETLIDEQKAAISYCFVDDCLLGSPDAEILKFAISHIKGSESPTLADDADYTAGVSATGPYHDVDFFVNIKQFMKMGIAEDSSGETKKYLTGLGLDNVKCLSGSFGIARLSGNGTIGKVLCKIDGDKKGIIKMLDIRSAPVQAPAFVPSSAYSVGLINLDIKEGFNELIKIVSGFSPGAASVFYTPLVPATEEGGPSIELKKDIIDYLGSQIVMAEWPEKSSPEKIISSEGIYAIGVSSRPSLEKTLSLLFNKYIATGNPDAKRELLGHTIYLIDLPNILPGLSARRSMIDSADKETSAAGEAPKMAFTVTDTHLVIGTEAAVEKTIRTVGNSGAGTVGSEQWFRNAKSVIPSSVGLAAFGNSTNVWEKLWQIFKRADSGQQSIISGPFGMQTLMPSMSKSDAPFDFKLLPAFETVRKYFGITAAYGISRPDGFYFELQYINSGS